MKRTAFKASFQLLLAALVLRTLAACGGHSAFENSMAISNEAKLKMFKEPTEVLPPTTSETATTEYSVYKLVEAKFGADANGASVSAQVKIESTAGLEIVDLVGGLRPDGTASLVDLHPLADSKNRLVAEALCVDIGKCTKIILNVYFNVAGKTYKKQFSSPSLHAPAPAQPAVPAASTKGPDGEEVHPSEKNLPKVADESDVKLGDFVGAPRNELLIGRLWERSKAPELPDVLARANDPEETQVPALKPDAPAPSVSSAKPTTKTPAKPNLKPATKSPGKSGALPVAPPPAKNKPVDSFVERWMKRAKAWLTPLPPEKPKTEELKIVVGPTARPPKPAKPVEAKPAKPIEAKPPAPKAAAVVAKPTVPPPPPVPAIPDPTKAKPQPNPPPVAPGREEKPTSPNEESAAETSLYPFPPAKPVPAEPALDQKITLLEAHLAPLVNLRDGGVAQGGYASSDDDDVKSSIVNASVLPTSIPGLVPITINHGAHYGSGMLVSFLENAATYLFKQLGLKLYVGDMSLKRGGSYGPSSSHNTHQNGLDADIAWIGIAHPLVDSALNSRGDVVEHFDYEKTWSFLRLAAKQEIVEDAQKSTAISRVFMSPAVKAGFCRWAKKTGLLDDPFDSELMRLVRPVTGHYKHFHLSLKCSPHYPLCRNLAAPPPEGTGCPAE